MKGTEKQVEWALQLKQNVKKVYEDLFKNYGRCTSGSEEDKKSFFEYVDAYYNAIIDIEDSRFWIETRFMFCMDSVCFESLYREGVRRKIIQDQQINMASAFYGKRK